MMILTAPLHSVCSRKLFNHFSLSINESRARQVNLGAVWYSHIHRGPAYVGGFTGRAFAFLENMTGFDAERDLQRDAAFSFS